MKNITVETTDTANIIKTTTTRTTSTKNIVKMLQQND